MSKLEEILLSIENSINLNEELFKQKYLLTNGKAGISIFYYYIGQHFNNEKFTDKAVFYLEECLASLEQNIDGTTLFGGFAGIAWLYQFYINEGIIDTDAESDQFFETSDRVCLTEAIKEASKKNYDLLYGVVGYGLYYLERHKSSDMSFQLTEIIKLLDQFSKRDEDGIFWEDHFKRDNKEGQLINLGLAHGVPSVIAFLLYAYQATDSKIAYQMVFDSVNWLINKSLGDGFKSKFSYYLLNGEANEFPSRLAWCYGDLGIASVIFQAAKICNNSQWFEFAERMAISSLERNPLDQDVAVRDCGFCHGTAGIGHLYNKFHDYTGNQLYKDAASKWFRITEESRVAPEVSIGGYLIHSYDEINNEWVSRKECGMLEGAAGIGLSIISNLTSESLGWDRCLILSN